MRKDNNAMKMYIGTTFLEILEIGMEYYAHRPDKKYLAYKVVDDDYGISYAVKEQRQEGGRYEEGWYHRHLTDVIFIPMQRGLILIGV